MKEAQKRPIQLISFDQNKRNPFVTQKSPSTRKPSTGSSKPTKKNISQWSLLSESTERVKAIS